jgi:NAD(P)H-dependent flavin oxidoreductase YrpB (nitropropane dioxygenase family)
VLDNIMTGKPGRMLRTKYIEGWHGPSAPAPLSWPMQSILNGYSYKRAERARDLDYWTYAVGQVIGDMKAPTTVRREFDRMLNEYLDALENLGNVTSVD